MRPLLSLVCACAVVLSARAADPAGIPLWPGTPPGSEGQTAAETMEERGKDGVVDRAIRQIHVPTLTPFLPSGPVATRVAVLIIPGGGFEHVTIDKEGYGVARWLAERGIAGLVLKYRLPKTPGNRYTVDTAFADTLQALKVARAHAAAWNIDPAKLGVMGFSAGGHLTILAGTRPEPADRPAFLVPMYPGVPETFETTNGLPPVFIAQASDDPLMASDGVLKFYAWARRQKVPIELHLFSSGGHGFGLGVPGSPPSVWPFLFLQWLRSTGIAPAP